MEDGSSATMPFIPTEFDALSTDPISIEPPVQCSAGSTIRTHDFASGLSSTESMDTTQPPSGSSQEGDVPRRDPQFYMNDGSCILRVENILFNVHRSVLSTDSSSFGTLFTLPQGDISVEGISDDNPIVLHGDTPEEFRNFLWSLYTLPPEISQITKGPHLDLNRFIDIAKVASKYSFKSVETWALDVIQEFIDKKPSPLFDTIPIGSPFSSNSPQSAFVESKRQLSRLVQLAQTCAHASLLETMIALLRRLMPVSLHFSYLAMSLADDLHLRELRGLAYLEVLQRSTFVCSRDENGKILVEGDVLESSDGLDCLVVSPSQLLRLLAGYYRLTKAWEKLRAIPVPFEHAPSCRSTWHQHGCTQNWSEFWKEKTRADGVLVLGAANVIGKLQVILKEFDKWGSTTYMNHDCRSVARRAIENAIKRINDSLPDFFHESGEY